MRHKAIALIGPSGSGKSSIGKALADKLGWTFIDADREIEKRSGLSIERIFEEKGEEDFRKMERLFLDELCLHGGEPFVLATGGGMPTFGDNLDKLKSFAEIVSLTAPLDILCDRISKGERRPMLSGQSKSGSCSDRKLLKKTLEELIARRASFYNHSKYKIDCSSENIEQIAEEIKILISSVSDES